MPAFHSLRGLALVAALVVSTLPALALDAETVALTPLTDVAIGQTVTLTENIPDGLHVGMLVGLIDPEDPTKMFIGEVTGEVDGGWALLIRE